MNSRRVVTIAVFLAVLGIALFGWSATRRVQRDRKRAAASQLQVTKVAMKWFFAGTMAPYFAARQNGIFTHNGVAVELLSGGPTSPSVQQVLLHNADFGITGAYELALARSEDQPLVSVAVIFKRSPSCLISLAKSGIRRPEDLVGKTVEMTQGDNSEFEFLAMLRRHGIDPSRVPRVRYLYNYSRLLAGETDAAVVYANDQAVMLAKQAATSLLCPKDWGVTPYADVLFTTEAMIRERPDWVGKVVRAFIEAWEWAARNQEQTVSYFLDAPEVKPLASRDSTGVFASQNQVAILSASLDYVRGETQPTMYGRHIAGIGMQDLSRWEETVQLLRDFGKRSKIPDPGACFSNRWAGLHEIEAKADTSSA